MRARIILVPPPPFPPSTPYKHTHTHTHINKCFGICVNKSSLFKDNDFIKLLRYVLVRWKKPGTPTSKNNTHSGDKCFNMGSNDTNNNPGNNMSEHEGSTKHL